jgi:hypothetical protein
MDRTIIQQGTFTADGTDKYVVLRSGVDWMRVYNYSAADGATNNDGFEYYWQRGMTNGTGLYWYHPAADQTVAVNALAAGTGFFYVDSSDTSPNAEVAITGATNAVTPTIATANTGALQTGSIVRLNSVTGATSLGGWDFEVDNIVTNTSFDMRYAMANAAGAAGTAGFYRHIPYDPIFYPRFRYIVNITQAANAVITTSVQHGFTVGQKIRVNLPDPNFDMIEINGVEGIVTAVTASTITTNIDSTAFTAFSFALPGDVPFTIPTVVPIGIDTGTAITGAVDLLADATRNTAYIGMRLPTGVASPGGANNDVMYWVAGKSFSDLQEG